MSDSGKKLGFVCKQSIAVLHKFASSKISDYNLVGMHFASNLS